MNLSDNARNLLSLLWNTALRSTGGEFGFSDDAFRQFDGSVQQFAGLYGALVTKGLIISEDDVEVNFKKLSGSQYYLTQAGADVLGVELVG